MHIKSMTLHGFKSYGAKTTIHNFDPQFNAITGLNGCGKSNILDAICFVLCQNAPTQFRVDSMSELVYKKGAGGIAFASVSIVFDNRKKKQSPINYQRWDEIEVERRIVLQGKSKYTINGATVTQTAVQDMFRSVQLNIQNPHFLIMQGRITKVLNMKPEEIWNMVEEAAGTMVYITKRDATLKVIHDKEKRVHEIEGLLTDVIKPQIDRLQKDRQDDIDRQKLSRMCERYQSQLAARTAYDLKNEAAITKDQRSELKIREKELEAEVELLEGEVTQMTARIAELEMGDSDQSAALKALETAATECRKKVIAIQSEIDSNRNLIGEEEAAAAENIREIEAKRVELVGLDERQAAIGEDLTAAEAKKTDLEGQVNRAQQAVAVIVTGVGGRDNADFGWKNQCTTAQENLNELDRRLNVVKGTLANLKKSVATVIQESASKAKSHEDVLQRMHLLEEEVAALKSRRESAAQEGNMAEIEGCRKKQRELLAQKAQLTQQINQREGQMRGLELPPRNNNAGQGFEPAKMYGAAAKLFSVVDPDKFLVAIDVAAGGKKFHFVCEDEETAKGVVRTVSRRVTVVPMSRAQGHVMPRAEVSAIQQKWGSDKVWPAIDLVKYDRKFENVVKYVIGSTLICADLDTANAVAFDRSLRSRPVCVTLNGDNVHPDGIVSGGQQVAKEHLMLGHVHMYNLLNKEYDTNKTELTGIAARLGEFERMETELQKLDADIHRKTNELSVVVHECDRNQGLRNLMDAERMKKEIETLEVELADGETRKAELTAKIADLKKKMSDTNAADAEKKEAEGNEAKCREAVRKQTDRVNAVVQRQVECQTAIENNKTTIESLKLEIADHRKRIAEYEVKIARKQEALQPVEAASLEAAKTYNDRRSGVAQKSVQLQEAQADKRTKEKERSKSKKAHEQAKSDLAVTKDTLRRIEKLLNEELFQQYPWLSEEFSKLGTPDSAYKVEEKTAAVLKAELEKCTKNLAVLNRALGKDNNFDFENIQRQYNDLIEKSQTCQSDRIQLQEIIKNLDIKKQELIELAVKEVNKHFGSIFAALLPNANCMLEREQDSHQRPLEALKIRVALGNSKTQQQWLWKESLSELSGGQRSLVALSLILAMLKMNPAPVYVLDEIDAALDLSHTQNVGKMIRMHFKQSQFVVVSLKEGMFNNANIVFRVGFQDGVSKVTAKVRDRSSRDDEDLEEEADDEDDD